VFERANFEIVRACQESFGFEVPGKKKNGKTRYVFSCVKFTFITCDEKINIVDIFIYALL